MTRLIGTWNDEDNESGSVQELNDGTRVNVVTVWTGTDADTEIEAPRPLTGAEIDAVMDLDALTDKAKGPVVVPERFPLQRRF